MDKIYLVTGASGHLGSVVVLELIKMGKDVRALAFSKGKVVHEEAQVFLGDVCDKESIRPCFEDLGSSKLIVIHCAGIVSIASKYNQRLYDVNVLGTQNLIDLCMEYKIERLVYVSSVHAIPEGPRGKTIREVTDFSPDKVVGEYSKTKAQASANVMQAVKEGLDACIVHPSGIVGPNDYGRGHTTSLIIDYYKGELKAGVIGGYDFVDVRDVARGVILACEKGRRGESYILSNRFFMIKEIITMLSEITGKKDIKVYMPIWFVKTIAPMAELYYKILKQPPLFSPYSIYTLNSNALFSHGKASKELGYSTRDMRETLKDTVNWLKVNRRM